MINKKDLRNLFDTAEIEQQCEELREKAARNQEIEAEKKVKMLEYVIEHLDVTPFIAIHATDYFPEKGVLKPTGYSLLTLFGSDNTKKIIQDLELKHPRMTVHFTLNYMVEGIVNAGQFFKWNTKYALLIPLKDFIHRVISLNPVDTWVIGELPLPPSAEILMPEKEYASMPKNWDRRSGKARIIPYPERLSLKEAVILRIRQEGYTVTTGGDTGWFEGLDISNLHAFIRKNAFLSDAEKERLVALAIQSGFYHWADIFSEIAKREQKKYTAHSKTLWRDIEMFSEELYGIIFNPVSTERNRLVAKMVKDFEIEYKTLPQLKGRIEIYIEKIQAEIVSGKYTNKEEIKSLKFLITEFIKIAKWLEELIEKAKHAQNMTWQEFLQREKLI